MYQYDSRSKAQPKQSKANTPVSDKGHKQAGIEIPVQTKSLFNFPRGIESSEEEKEDQKIPKSVPDQPNNTGIPTPVKSQFESLSGFSFDDVRVHYNSGKPEQLQALAYTQGNQVYISPGQERHLGHELGHVVQQKQGRVKATTQLKGVDINDDSALEREADQMGKKAPPYTPQSVTDDYIKFLHTTQYKKTIQGQFGQVVQRNAYWKCYQDNGAVVKPGDATHVDNHSTLDNLKGNAASLQALHNYRLSSSAAVSFWMRPGNTTSNDQHHLYNDEAAAQAAADGGLGCTHDSVCDQAEKDVARGTYYYNKPIEQGKVGANAKVVANHTQDTNANLQKIKISKIGIDPYVVTNGEMKAKINHFHRGQVVDDDLSANADRQPHYNQLGNTEHYLVKP